MSTFSNPPAYSSALPAFSMFRLPTYTSNHLGRRSPYTRYTPHIRHLYDNNDPPTYDQVVNTVIDFDFVFPTLEATRAQLTADTPMLAVNEEQAVDTPDGAHEELVLTSEK